MKNMRWVKKVGANKSHGVEVRIEDVDKDGDADIAVYVDGLHIGSIQFSTLVENVNAEVGRLRKRLAKLVSKPAQEEE